MNNVRLNRARMESACITECFWHALEERGGGGEREIDGENVLVMLCNELYEALV